MVGDSVAAGGGRRPGRFLPAVGLRRGALRRWALWRLPRRGQVLYLVAIDTLAVAATVLAALRFPPLATMQAPIALLLGGMQVSAELDRAGERHREETLLGPGVDTPWIFAGAPA